MKVVIVDYNMGNIKSIVGALHYIGVDSIIVSNDYDELANANKLILPGVGSFAQAMGIIQEKKLDTYLHDLVINHKKPLLGICLGMQLMGLSSTEHSEHLGLGFIAGEVTRLDYNRIKVPHVGFNQVNINKELRLYHEFDGTPDFYFTHSYKMNSSANINQCLCDYGEQFIASYELDNIAGVQFHPELSQKNGLKLLANFIEKF